MNRIKREIGYPLLALAVGLAAWQFLPRYSLFANKPKPGDPIITALPLAPRLFFTDLKGQTLDTSSFKGKVVLVNFWAAWCTPCADEIPGFIALQQKYGDLGLLTIGVSMEDDDSELRHFYQRAAMNYPVIAGDQKIAEAYGGILGLPTTFVIDRYGFVQRKQIGSTDFSALEKEVVTLLSEKADNR